jgi:hypothetical protein
MKKSITLLITLLVLIFNSFNASACTIFNASENNMTLVGNNEDWTDKDAKVWFLPSDVKKYGRVYFGFFNADPQGGMNDQGIFIDFIAKSPIKLAPSDFTGSLIEKVLEECSTLNQALDICRKNIARCLGYGDFMIVDQLGNSAVISWNWNTNTIQIDQKDGKYLLIGYGESILKPVFETGDLDISVKYFQELLDNAHQENLAYSRDQTIYSNVYDLKNKKVYLNYLHDFKYTIEFDLNTELQKGKHLYDLFSIFPQNKYSWINSFLDKQYAPGSIILLAILITVLGSPFIFWTACNISNKRKSVKISAVDKLNQKNPPLLLAAKLATILSSVLCLILIYFIMQYSSFMHFYGLSICGKVFSLIPLFILILAVFEIVFAFIIWKNKFWSLLIRLYYSLFILVVIIFKVLIDFVFRVT